MAVIDVPRADAIALHAALLRDGDARCPVCEGDELQHHATPPFPTIQCRGCGAMVVVDLHGHGER